MDGVGSGLADGSGAKVTGAVAFRVLTRSCCCGPVGPELAKTDLSIAGQLT